MKTLTAGQSVLQELAACFNRLSASLTDQLIDEIKRAERVFCVGAGRSCIILNAFCMRLNQLGIESYVAGNVPCPPARSGDLVIAASGSGATPSVVVILKRAKAAGARIVLLTASPVQDLDGVVDVVIDIQAPNSLINRESQASRQPMRTLFEQTCFILQEAVVAVLSEGIPPEEIAARHTNLE
jgi:6-phospho-3-hexuloisomerase